MSVQRTSNRSDRIFWFLYAVALVACLAVWAAFGSAYTANASHYTFDKSRGWYADVEVTQADMYDLGCATADAGREGYTTIFYGAPVRVDKDGAWVMGVSRWSQTDRPLENGGKSVKALTKDFIQGYDACASSGQFLVVAMGVSNCSLGGGNSECPGGQSYKTLSWIEDHGEAMADIVEDLDDWTYPDYDDHVLVKGGWDMEPSWADYLETHTWLEGYDQNTVISLMGNYSADGCPSSQVYNSSTNGSCNNGYNQWRVWHLVDGHAVQEMPQIYTDALARQWMRLEEYGNHAENNGLYFYGAMGGEGQPHDTAHQAHKALWDELNNPAAGHSPNHAAQSTLTAGMKQFGQGHGMVEE